MNETEFLNHLGVEKRSTAKHPVELDILPSDVNHPDLKIFIFQNVANRVVIDINNLYPGFANRGPSLGGKLHIQTNTKVSDGRERLLSQHCKGQTTLFGLPGIFYLNS